MKRLFPIFALMTVACASSAPRFSDERSPAQTPSLIDDVPSKFAFSGWRDQTSYVQSPVPFDKLLKVAFKCDKPSLYPSHPQQSLKLYHVFKVGSYDHFKLPGDDDLCKIGNKTPNGSGKKLCFAADTLEYAVISDVYEDDCGNFYRGYHEVMFQKRDETMGSLFSAGRMVFQDPKSSYDKDMIDGHTYAVPASEFLFLTDVFPGEVEKSRALREIALKQTHRFDSRTHTFARKN